MKIYTELDWVLVPLFFLVIFLFAFYIRNKNRNNPIYYFFIPGILIKCIGSLVFCFIYTHLYNNGGDTLLYHLSGKTMTNLFFKDLSDFFTVLFGSHTTERYYFFDDTTGYPLYWEDGSTTNVVRLITPFELISFGSFPATSLLMAVFGFSGLWKLFQLFSELYPPLYRQFAISILFVPSVIFWGSGILKDTITVSSVCWFCYCFHQIFISKKPSFFFIFGLLLFSFIMILVKPYVFVSILPGSILWGIMGTIKRIKNVLLRISFGPFVIVLGALFGFGIWTFISPNLGKYSSLESMMEKAQSSQKDLKQDYYQGNSFDLGEFEMTPMGLLSKFPEATMAGLFRPFIWEVKNIQMVISGLENLAILIFTVFFLIRVPISFFKQIKENPLVSFCILFSILFAFGVGLSTSNFGALVRFRIPIMPFYFSAMFIINHHRIIYKMNRQNSDIF